MKRIAAIACLLLSIAPVAVALEPKEVFLLVNKNFPASKEVAEHYCQKRGVPAENVIVLDVPITEDISRADYNQKIVAPVRTALREKKAQAKVLLSIHGMPLRVGGVIATAEDQENAKKVAAEIKEKQQVLDVLKSKFEEMKNRAQPTPDAKADPVLDKMKMLLAEKQTELVKLLRVRDALSQVESQASVDSELMMLWWDGYALARWQINLLHWKAPAKAREGKPPYVMTCRLDGPTPAIAKGLVDQAMEVEKKGLEGKVYVDARGIRFDATKQDDYGYSGYDESMREMAAFLKTDAKMDVTLDDKSELFLPDSCPDCALYCGWYSHANFIDSNRFVPGAIAWHLASSEAVSLRRTDTKYWCRNLLEKGVAATLGPVAEPYTIGFPKPAEFFGMLATGQYTLVESYSRTVLLSSWMTVLIGDPLYKPFAKNPRLKEEQIFESPKGGRSFFAEK